MNKILASLFALLMMCSVAFGQQRLTGPQRGIPGGAGDPLRQPGIGGTTGDSCGCVTATYMFCYNGDMSSAPGRACFTNGTNWKDGTTAGSVTVTSDYVLIENVNSYITWAVSGEDGIADQEGTIFLSFYVVDDGDDDLEGVTIFESYIDANNTMYCIVNGTSNKVVCYHKGTDSAQNVESSSTISHSTWYRLGYTWHATADGTGAKHSISVVALGNDPTWSEAEEGLKTWTTSPTDITLGENNASTPMTDDVRVADVIILSGYQTDDPRQ